MKRLAVPCACLALSGCVSEGPRQPEASDLPPLRRDYRAPIVAWAQTFYADRRTLRGARISDPVPARDSTGRLVWLVCVEVDAGEAAGFYRLAPQAFGFAPDYVSAPLERRGSSLTREDCANRTMTWRPFPEMTAGR